MLDLSVIEAYGDEPVGGAGEHCAPGAARDPAAPGRADRLGGDHPVADAYFQRARSGVAPGQTRSRTARIRAAKKSHPPPEDP